MSTLYGRDYTMRITYLRDTSPTAATCPTLYSTDRGTFLVQGKKISDAAILLPFGLGDDEDAVEVPARLLEEIADDAAFPPGNGQGVIATVVRAVPRDTSAPSVSATSRESFVVRGARVTDPEALAAMNIPDDEAVVEVPRDLLPEVSTDAA